MLRLLLFGILLTAAITDLKRRRIPNRLTFAAMAAGLIAQAGHDGWLGAVSSLAGITLGLGLLLPVYAMGGMGAGDVKLLGAVGGFLGPGGVVTAFLVSAGVGGLYAFAVWLSHWGIRDGFRRLLSLLTTLCLTGRLRSALTSPDSQPQLRYGVAIALGTMLSVLL
jgi:prepilin peptidase CpaA